LKITNILNICLSLSLRKMWSLFRNPLEFCFSIFSLTEIF
jgi:hypothetical protein